MAWKKIKIQSGGKAMNLTSNQSACRLDSNGVNDTPIRVRMKEIEAVKVGLNFDDWAGLMKAQFGLSSANEIWPTLARFRVKTWPS